MTTIRRMAVVLLAGSAFAACGKKGPPLAPLNLLPAPATDVALKRIGDTVVVRLKLPTGNTTGRGPIELDHIELYAVTIPAGSVAPANRELLHSSHLIGELPVKPPPVEDAPPPPDDAPKDPRPSPGETVTMTERVTAAQLEPSPLAFKVPPLPPASGRGATASGTAAGEGTPATVNPAAEPPTPSAIASGVIPSPDTSAAATPGAVPGTVSSGTTAGTSAASGGAPDAGAAGTAPAVTGTAPSTTPGAALATGAPGAAASIAAAIAAQLGPPKVPYLTRIYMIRGITKKGRPGPPSSGMQMPLLDPPAAPPLPTVTFSASAVTLAWQPVPFVPPPPPAIEAPAARGTPAATTVPGGAPGTTVPGGAGGTTVPGGAPATTVPVGAPPTTVAGPPPAVPPAVPPPTAYTYNVYSASDGTGGDSAPKPLNAQPLTEPGFEHPGAEPGAEQCFVVRTVETIGTATIESEPSPRQCVTPRDIFPPAPPKGLNATPFGPGVISLIWEANTEPDLGGYIVLRGEAPGDTLQPLTPEPIHETVYLDKTAKSGIRYVYALVAVDRATPPNRSAPSARVQETSR